LEDLKDTNVITWFKEQARFWPDEVAAILP